MKVLNEKINRITLGILLLVLALNAFGGGYYGMLGAENVPTEWLKGSPFKNYFIPSLFLFLFIGGTSITASILVFKNHRCARKLAFISGIIVLMWICTQVLIIGYVSWMQPTTAIAGLIIVSLSYLLPKYA